MSITAHCGQIESLYFEIIHSGARAIGLSAPHGGCGTSSIAIALTERFMLAGKSTLLVDFNHLKPALETVLPLGIANDNGPFDAPAMMSPRASELVVNAVVAQPSRSAIERVKQPGYISKQFASWLTAYDYIIVDSGPIYSDDELGLPAEEIISCCEAYMLVVKACQTSETQVQESLRKLRKCQAWFLGCIINDVENPTLQRELMRELNRLPNFANWLRRSLVKLVISSRFLSMEV